MRERYRMADISIKQLVSSPACIPQMTLEEILPGYAGLGFRKFEAFSGWCKSHLDFRRDPAEYLALARANGFEYTSFHLPPVTDDFDRTLADAVAAAKFAGGLGAS